MEAVGWIPYQPEKILLLQLSSRLCGEALPLPPMQLARQQDTIFALILQPKDDMGNCKMWTKETYFKIMGILSALPLLLGETLYNFGGPSELSDKKTREVMGPRAMAWTAVLDATVSGRPGQKPHSYHNASAFSFRKKTLSVEHNQRRLLRCCFLAWQRWSQAETEKRELQSKREEKRRKMAQLLEAVSLGKGGLDRPLEVNKPGTAEVSHHQDLQQDKVNPSHVVLSIGIPVLVQSTSFVQSEIKSTLSQRKASFPGWPPNTCLQLFRREVFKNQRQTWRTIDEF